MSSPLNAGTEIAEWHRRGADFCSLTQEIARHERYAEIIDALVAVARAAEKVVAAYDADVAWEELEVEALREALARLDKDTAA